jgi:hypothetical protein
MLKAVSLATGAVRVLVAMIRPPCFLARSAQAKE